MISITSTIFSHFQKRLRIFKISYGVLYFTHNTPMHLKIVTVPTTPYLDQEPGTSGLRRLTKVYQQENYIENFTQCILNTLDWKIEGCSLLVGGDGRYFCKEAAEKIIRVCAGNRVGHVFVGHEALFSSPAAAHFIEKHRLAGAIILTASHNPGGPDADFGIKFNGESGGPVPPKISDQIKINTKKITEYFTVPDLIFDLSNIGTVTYNISGKDFVIEVINFVDDYVTMLKEIFDFDDLRNLIQEQMTLEDLK